MGACFNSMELDGNCTKEQVTAKFNERCMQDGYECGHSYSGSFSEFRGLVFHDKLFDTKAQAEDYVDEHGEKWGPAVCVRYRHVEPTKQMFAHSEAIRKMNSKIWEATRELEQMKTKMRINNRKTKPAYVTNAEIKLQQVKDTLQPKIKERQAKIVEIETVAALKANDVRWYLGGWCSS